MTKIRAAAFSAVAFLFLSGSALAGGTVVGRVRYEGEVPLAKRRPMTVDAAICGPEAVTQNLILGKKGVVQGVVVALEGTTEWNVAPPAPPTGYTVDAKRCRLDPHIVVIPADSDLKILNSDHLNHFYSIESRTNTPTSVALPKAAAFATLHLEFPEIVELRCDIHEGERARIVVARHPYIAVSDAEGRFEIKDVPVGNFIISFWQEFLGSSSRRIQVREGEVTPLEIVLGPRKQSDFPTQPAATLSVNRLDVNVLPIMTVR